jgi:hypothetical protein
VRKVAARRLLNSTTSDIPNDLCFTKDLGEGIQTFQCHDEKTSPFIGPLSGTNQGIGQIGMYGNTLSIIMKTRK